MIYFIHPSGIQGAWYWVNPALSTEKLRDIECAVYAWRLEHLREIVRARLDGDA